MIFLTLIILIICKALLKESLLNDFYYRLTAIVLLFSALLTLNNLINVDIVTGIGIYSGLFHINLISQVLEIFLLVIGSLILISWPIQTEMLIEVINTKTNNKDLNVNNIISNLNTNIPTMQSTSAFQSLALREAEDSQNAKQRSNSIGSINSEAGKAVAGREQDTNSSINSSIYSLVHGLLLERSNKKSNINNFSHSLALQFSPQDSETASSSSAAFTNGQHQMPSMTNAAAGSASSVADVSRSAAGELRAREAINYSIITNNNFISYSINYSILVLFCTLGASLLISCSDLISMYLSIELQSFSLYVLSTLYKDSELSTNAGLKYFLLGGLSSCLILFGAGLIYAYTGITNFESIYSFLSVYSLEINDNLLQIFYPFITKDYNSSILLGFIFIFVGFLIKISAAPFHNWSPDVYDESPTIVTIWLTLIPKISILILLLELHIHIDLIDQLSLFGNLKLFNLNILTITKNLLLISSLLSLIIGSVVGLAQNRIKRLLAYSTISHIGFIFLGLGINSYQSIDSFIFYIIQYIITNLNIFLIIIGLSYISNRSINKEDNNLIKDIRYISEFKGQFYLNPLIILSFSICLFSMAGIPPLIGFFSKQFVLYSAIQNGYNFIAIVAIFVSVISASYYLKIIKTFFINLDSTHSDASDASDAQNAEVAKREINTAKLMQNAEVEENRSLERLSNLHSFLISTLTLSILFFIFKPSLILNITQLLSLSLFYI